MFRGRATSDGGWSEGRQRRPEAPGVQTGAARKREIKAWVIEALALSEDTTVMVTELACKEPGCPPIETVIAVLRGPGDTTQFKSHRAAVELDKDTVVTLVRRALSRAHDEDDDVPPLDVSEERF
jgi:hypothetical protein